MNLKKYFAGAVMATVALVSASPLVSFAADPLLTCAPVSSTVIPGERLTFKASGGNGVYSWNAPGMTTQTGSELTVYYPRAGTSFVTLSSNGQTATCSAVISGTVGGSQPVSCGPLNRSLAVSERTTFTASGGNGIYTWTATGMNSQTGPTLNVYYASAGISSVTVSSGGTSATCNATIGGGTTPTTAIIWTPGLPNTGSGGSSQFLLNMGLVLSLAAISTLVISKRTVSNK